MSLARSSIVANEKVKMIKKIARKNGIKFQDIIESPRKDKKFRIYFDKDDFVDFGASGSQTYLEGASDEKKLAYQKRHSQIYLKDGRRAIDVKYSPAWLSMRLLWS